MRLKTFTFCLFASICALGQETVLKEKKGESYYVLKDNQKIKHGSYQYSTKSGIIEKGQFDNDKKIGVWEYYDADGTLEQKYDYTLKQLLFNKEDADKKSGPFGGYKVVVDGKPTDIIPDTPPIFIGGRSRYDRFISKNLKYPDESKSRGFEDREFVTIVISSQGEFISCSTFRSFAEDLRKEALRLMNELPNEWIPAKHQGKEVDCSIFAVVRSDLNKSADKTCTQRNIYCSVWLGVIINGLSTFGLYF